MPGLELEEVVTTVVLSTQSKGERLRDVPEMFPLNLPGCTLLSLGLGVTSHVHSHSQSSTEHQRKSQKLSERRMWHLRIGEGVSLGPQMEGQVEVQGIGWAGYRPLGVISLERVVIYHYKHHD